MQTDISIIDLMKMRWSRDAAVTVEQFLTEIGGMMLGTVGTSVILEYRFVDANASNGTLELAPTATGNVYGVSDKRGGPGSEIRIRIGGKAKVYTSGSVSDQDELVATTGGYAATALGADRSLMSAVGGADASDDIAQTNLPDQVSAICAADESGNTLIIRGDVGGTYTVETLTLVDTDTATSVNTFDAIYSLQTTLAAVGTIDIKDATLVGLLIPQISALAAARHYGAILTDDSDDAGGLEIAINAGGTNASDVVVIGTDRLGVAKTEVFTLSNDVRVDSGDTYRTVTTLLIGADGIAWNAGVTSKYDIAVPNTADRAIRGFALADQATAGETVDILIRSQGIGMGAGFTGDRGGVESWTAAATDIAKWRFVDINSSALLEAAPVSGGQILGVSDEAITASTSGSVRTGGKSYVYPAADVTALDELVAVTGGLAAPMLTADAGLMSAVGGADANDDIVQTNLPDQVSAICGDDETGNTLIIRGKVGATYTEETLTLVDTDTATSTNTWAAIYSLETTATSAGTIDLKDATLVGLLIPQIAGSASARHYGAILTDDADDAKGIENAINAGGANASDVVVIGTDYIEAAQKETITLDGTTPVVTTKPYRTITTLLIGADGIAWNAGVTSLYDINAPNTLSRTVRGVAEEAQTASGEPVGILLRSGLAGRSESAANIVFAKRFTTVGGNATESFTCTGVLATDKILVTINVKGGTPRTIVQANYASANTVDVVFTDDPSNDHQISIVVIRS